MKKTLLILLFFQMAVAPASYAFAGEASEDAYQQARKELHKPKTAYEIAATAFLNLDSQESEFAARLAYMAGYAAYLQDAYDSAAYWFFIAEPISQGVVQRADVQYNLGEMFRRAGLYKEAISYAKSAYNHFKNNDAIKAAYAMHSAGLSHLSLSEFAQAMYCFEQSLEHNQSEQVINLLSYTYLRVGERELRKGYSPTYEGLILEEGLGYRRMPGAIKNIVKAEGLPLQEVAREIFVFLLKKEMAGIDEAWVSNNYGYYFLQKEEVDSAYKYYTYTNELAPGSNAAAYSLFNLARYQYAKGKFFEANVLLDSLFSIPSEVVDTRFHNDFIAFSQQLENEHPELFNVHSNEFLLFSKTRKIDEIQKEMMQQKLVTGKASAEAFKAKQKLKAHQEQYTKMLYLFSGILLILSSMFLRKVIKQNKRMRRISIALQKH